MTFTFSSSVLAKAVKSCCQVINPKAALPVMQNILLSLTDTGKLFLTAGNETESVTLELEPAVSSDAAEIMVDARTFLDALNNLFEQPVTITVTHKEDTTEGTLTLIHQDGNTFIPAYFDTDIYPDMGLHQQINDVCAVDAEELVSGIEKVKWAVSKDGYRLALENICLEREKGTCFNLIATNGYVLMQSRHDTNQPSDDEKQILIPQGIANILPNLIVPSSVDEHIKIATTDNLCRMQQDGWVLYYTLPSVQFPKYKSVIPENHTTAVTVDRRKLMRGLKYVLSFSTDIMQVDIDFLTGTIELFANNLEFQKQARYTIASTLEGEPLKIGVSGANLLNILKKFTSEEVTIKATTADRAFTVQSIENSSLMGLSMPMLRNE